MSLLSESCDPVVSVEHTGQAPSRGPLSRPVSVRDDAAAWVEAWPDARILRVNGRGQVRLVDRQLMLEPAADLYSEPPARAVLLASVARFTSGRCGTSSSLTIPLREPRSSSVTCARTEHSSMLLTPTGMSQRWHC